MCSFPETSLSSWWIPLGHLFSRSIFTSPHQRLPAGNSAPLCLSLPFWGTHLSTQRASSSAGVVTLAKKKIALNTEEEGFCGWEPPYPPPRLRSGRTLGVADIFSEGPGALNLRACSGDILDNAPYWTTSLPYRTAPSPTGVSWGRLPNKLVLKSLCCGMLLGEPRPRQPQNMGWVTPCGWHSVAPTPLFLVFR